MSLKFTSVPNKILKVTIDAAATSLVIDSIEGWDGLALTSGDFGTEAYGCLRNSTGTEIEFFKWDPSTIANGTTTGVTMTTRGLKFDGDLTTSVGGNKKVWIKNNTVVMLGSDVSQIFQWLKEYIDAAAVAGAVDASTTLKGIVEEATEAEINSDTVAGGTSARLYINPSTLVTSKYGLRLPSADEKAALAGGGGFGTPSTSNKYLTEEYLSGTSNVPIVRKYENSGSPHTWTRPAGLKYIVVEVQGAGGGAQGSNESTNDVGGYGGGAGGYTRKLIAFASLGATETVTVGAGGAGGAGGSGSGTSGGSSSFGSHCSATGGVAGGLGSEGGVGSGGDFNLEGGSGFPVESVNNGGAASLLGGTSFMGGPKPVGSPTSDAGNYGAGGSGSERNADYAGGKGGNGVIIVTEYYV